MRWNALVLASLLSSAACDGELQSTVPPPPTEPDPAAQPETEVTGALTGFPCDVYAALEATCASCHSGDTYAPVIATRAAFLAPRPDGTVGSLAAQRIQDNKMPPYGAPQPTAADAALILDWIAAGMPAGACGALTRQTR